MSEDSIHRRVFIAHITRGEYDLFLKGMALDSSLPPSYEAWIAATRAIHEDYRRAGLWTVPVVISWHGFVRHARSSRVFPSYELINIYANYKGRRGTVLR